MFVQINIFENSESGEMNENLFDFIYVFEYYYFSNIIHRWILDLASWSKGNVKFWKILIVWEDLKFLGIT